jgi:hypothetical protein
MVSKISGIVLYFLPALRVCGIEVSVLAACHGGAAPAERQQLAFAALLKLCIVTVLFHLAHPDIRQPIGEHIGNLAVLYPAAGVHIPGGKDRQVAVAAVAAAVDGIITCTVYPEVPPRVEYALSDLGESMRPIMDAMEIWGTAYKKSKE